MTEADIHHLMQTLNMSKNVPIPDLHEMHLIQRASHDVALKSDVPRMMALTSALGAASIACQGLINVEHPFGSISPTSLYILITGESGVNKSAVHEHFFDKSLSLEQRQRVETWQTEHKAFGNAHKLWTIRHKEAEMAYRKSLRSDFNNPNEELEKNLEKSIEAEPVEPKNYRFIYDDVTPSALIESLGLYSKYIGLISDDAHNTLTGRALNNVSSLNTLWDGRDVSVIRTQTNPNEPTDARLSIFLMTQPFAVEEMMDKKGDRFIGTGLLPRFLVNVIPNRDKPRKNHPTEMKGVADFNRRITELLGQSLEAEKNNLTPYVMRFTEEAKTAWFLASDAIDREAREGIYITFKGHAYKIMNNVSRIAALVSFIDHKDIIGLSELRFAFHFAINCSRDYISGIFGKPDIIVNTEILVKALIDKARKERQVLFDAQNSDYSVSKLKVNQLAVKDQSAPAVYSFNEGFITQGYQIEFNTSELTKGGKIRNREIILKSIELLREMGHITDGKIKSFLFSEVPLFKARTPDVLATPHLRNGENIVIKGLPKFEEFFEISFEQYLEGKEHNHLYKWRYPLFASNDDGVKKYVMTYIND